jgi:hypothetical protein
MNFLEKYKEYYKVRAHRYSNSKMYANVCKAETDLFNAVDSCKAMEEIKDRIGNLNHVCARELVRDEYEAEMKHFLKHDEDIRVLEAKMVLSDIGTYEDISELMTHIHKVCNDVSIQVSMDESHATQVFGDMNQIEEYLVYSQAIVPDKYKSKMQQISKDISRSIREGVNSLEQNNSQWQSGWKLQADICFEKRHIRRSPIKIDRLKEMVEVYNRIIQD